MKRQAALLSIIGFLVACSPPPQETRERDWEKEAPDQREIQAYGEESPRVTTRILYLADTTPPTSPGQMAINYGQPSWKPEYQEKFDALTIGKRWRFGNNDWTSLDTNVALNVAGTEVKPGHYYLLLERSRNDQWYLVLLDPKVVRARRLDAFFVDEAPEGTKAPLNWKRTEEPADKLSVRLIPDEKDLKKALLEIRWGTHMLSAEIEASL